jgi:hypothetical protein
MDAPLGSGVPVAYHACRHVADLTVPVLHPRVDAAYRPVTVTVTVVATASPPHITPSTTLKADAAARDKQAVRGF